MTAETRQIVASFYIERLAHFAGRTAQWFRDEHPEIDWQRLAAYEQDIEADSPAHDPAETWALVEGELPSLAAKLDDATLVTRRSMVLRGWMINAVNPKGTVFLLAVVPQFMSLSQPLLPQYLTISATLGFTDLVVMAGYTALASRLLGALKSPAHIRTMNRAFGSLFVLAGSLLALFKRAL